MSGVKGMKHKDNGHKYKQEQLEDMCHNYLRDNFHKFSDANKQRIALQIASKMVVQRTDNKTEIEYKDTVTPQLSKDMLLHINRISEEVYNGNTSN